VRILAFQRIGELLGPAKQTGNNKWGRTGKPEEIESQHQDSISGSPKQQQQRDWQARKVAEHVDL